MKKYLFFAASALILASCSNDEFIGDSPVTADDGAICFTTTNQGMTRATGAEAASLLSNQFTVYAVKTKGSAIEETFTSTDESETPSKKTDYVVDYVSDAWTYLNQTGQKQKYWDATADKYDFYAWKGASVSHTRPTNSNETAAFTITPTSADDMAATYVAAHEERTSANGFNSPVSFQFKSMAAKVRLGFFEVVPGYHVAISGVYADGESGTTAQKEKTYLFNGNNTFYTNGVKYTVDYNNFGTTALTVASDETHIAKNLAFGNKEIAQDESTLANCIGTSPTTATTTEGKLSSTCTGYVNVLPMPANQNDLHLKVVYDLIAEDLSEAIKGRVAEVVIPYEYAQWKPNYAYSYLFKITDSELNPITFTAEVTEVTESETVTKIDKDDAYSITTSQPDLVSDGKYDYFVAGKAFDIFVESRQGVAQTLKAENLKVYYANNTTTTEYNAASNIVAENAQTVTFANGVATFTPAAGKSGCYIVEFTVEGKNYYKVLNVADYVIENKTATAGTEVTPALTMHYGDATKDYTSLATFTVSDSSVAIVSADGKKVNAQTVSETKTCTITAFIGAAEVSTATFTVNPNTGN